MFGQADRQRRLLLSALLPLSFLAACNDQRPPNHFAVVAGRVVARHADTGEFSILGRQRKEADGAKRTIYCLVTHDSEVYISDKLSSINDIQLGDEVEMIGRVDTDTEPRRFLVSFAYIDHTLPPTPPPSLAPTSSPASRDTTNQPDTRED